MTFVQALLEQMCLSMCLKTLFKLKIKFYLIKWTKFRSSHLISPKM